jgi:hypothetical protein
MGSGGSQEGASNLLRTLGPRTRGLALVLLVIDSIFGLSIFSVGVTGNMSGPDFVVAIIVLGALLLASLIAITLVELTVQRDDQHLLRLRRSRRTPDSAVLDGLVNSTLEMICRTTSLPLAPDQAGMRAFIFKREGDSLVCRYYWALNPTSEKVGVTRFPLNQETARSVAVVRCALDGKITRTHIGPLSEELEEATSDTVDDDLTFVLAAPILDGDQRAWGTIDFDTSNELGKERLSTGLADAAIFQLAQHLQVIFGLQNDNKPDS